MGNLANDLGLFAVVIGLTALAGCEPDPVPEPTLESIQELVFKRRCAEPACHGTDFPRQGLELFNSSASLKTTVNVPPNVGDAALFYPARIVPGEPDHSFLVAKIVGPVASQGLRMPTGRTPLSEATIAAIRDWIASMPR